MEENKTTQTNATKEQVLDLIKKKEALEKELADLNAVLSSQNVGMTEPLVDEEGFPRSDIDVYQVRHARSNISRKKNDLKDLMKQIEECLHSLHGQARDGIGSNEGTDSADPLQRPNLEPFAKVLVVCEGSPAAEARIKVGDLISKFGSVDADNFESLATISKVVENSANRPLAVLLIRNGEQMQVSLTPKVWSGKGLLGFKIRPVDHDADR